LEISLDTLSKERRKVSRRKQQYRENTEKKNARGQRRGEGEGVVNNGRDEITREKEGRRGNGGGRGGRRPLWSDS